MGGGKPTRVRLLLREGVSQKVGILGLAISDSNPELLDVDLVDNSGELWYASIPTGREPDRIVAFSRDWIDGVEFPMSRWVAPDTAKIREDAERARWVSKMESLGIRELDSAALESLLPLWGHRRDSAGPADPRTH